MDGFDLLSIPPLNHHTFVLSELLGNKNVRLYDGSMVEWTKDQSRPLVSEKSNLAKIKELLNLG
jgi:thiosulfate/3-mercaptopyruvate sulfurtransferase